MNYQHECNAPGVAWIRGDNRQAQCRCGRYFDTNYDELMTEFRRLLDEHDWNFDRADDGIVFRRGERSRQNLLYLSARLGYEAITLFAERENSATGLFR